MDSSHRNDASMSSPSELNAVYAAYQESYSYLTYLFYFTYKKFYHFNLPWVVIPPKG